MLPDYAPSEGPALLARELRAGEAKGAVWIVDESSLLATRHVNMLLHQARAAQVARVIFVGDQRQHGAVEAGRPIAQLQQAGMETAQLDSIRRQRDPELRKAIVSAANATALRSSGSRCRRMMSNRAVSMPACWSWAMGRPASTAPCCR